jgi:hypothetical protein
MDKWEYNKLEYQYATHDNSQAVWDKINELGLEGWELVSVVSFRQRSTAECLVAWLKRLKQ